MRGSVGSCNWQVAGRLARSGAARVERGGRTGEAGERGGAQEHGAHGGRGVSGGRMGRLVSRSLSIGARRKSWDLRTASRTNGGAIENFEAFYKRGPFRELDLCRVSSWNWTLSPESAPRKLGETRIRDGTPVNPRFLAVFRGFLSYSLGSPFAAAAVNSHRRLLNNKVVTNREREFLKSRFQLPTLNWHAQLEDPHAPCAHSPRERHCLQVTKPAARPKQRRGRGRACAGRSPATAAARHARPRDGRVYRRGGAPPPRPPSGALRLRAAKRAFWRASAGARLQGSERPRPAACRRAWRMPSRPRRKRRPAAAAAE